MTGGLVYLQSDYFSEHLCNLSFIRAAECSDQEEAALRQALRRHFELTGSPRAAALLESGMPLPFVRLQPLQLSSTPEETWAPILKHLQVPAEREHDDVPVFEGNSAPASTMVLDDLPRVSAD
jgi:hypothetical protein